MGTEYIRVVRVKRDGVYLTSKSGNDGQPFCCRKSDSLTEIHMREGQAGLDREMIRMLCEYAVINGKNPSVTRYQPCLSERDSLHEEFIRKLNAEYEKLPDEGKTAVLLSEDRQTPEAKAYKTFSREAENEYYTALVRFIKTPEAPESCQACCLL